MKKYEILILILFYLNKVPKNKVLKNYPVIVYILSFYCDNNNNNSKNIYIYLVSK